LRIKKAYGRRTVQELLQSSIRVKSIDVINSVESKKLSSIIELAQSKRIPIIKRDRKLLDQIINATFHQGVIAHYETPTPWELTDLVHHAKKQVHCSLLIFDGIQDPQNLGAVIRSAEVLGASGVIIRKKRSAELNSVAMKASAGSAFRLPVVIVANLDQTVRVLKKNGYWIYGLDTAGSTSIWQTKFSGHTAFVMGNEEVGISKLLQKRCDNIIHIPQRGTIGSLNVSVATGIVMAEWLRQRTNDSPNTDQ
jgi:23S rRNA (guanosine2251-2'-O)-methyltransferase